MNKVLWLRGQASLEKIFKHKRERKAESPSKIENANAVYIALPSNRVKNACSTAQVMHASKIFVVLPQKDHSTSKSYPSASAKRKSFISAAALSFVCFIAMIFIAIGMLNLMISSFRLQAYTQGSMVLEQAAHKPGSGPAPQDAVVNEYQHALTREMVAAADTSLVITAGKTDKHKGMLEQITIGEEASDSATETGPLRKVRIYNGTERKLDRVVVQIDVLDKTGRLLRTEYHTARSIAPLQEKIVALDEPAPGAEIRCYVQEVRSKSLRTSLRSL